MRAPYRAIDARASKRARAEPVAALYERGLVHVGRHPELEKEMTSFTGAPGERSPDRLDALVHGLTDLMGYATAELRESGASRRPALCVRGKENWVLPRARQNGAARW